MAAQQVTHRPSFEKTALVQSRFQIRQQPAPRAPGWAFAQVGLYTEGSPIRDRNIAEQYLRLILNAIGITDVTVVAGGGAKAVDMCEATMEGFVAKHAVAIQQSVLA